MYCEKCGTRIDDDAVFCPKCGNRIGKKGNDLAGSTQLESSYVKLNSSQRMIRSISAVVIALSIVIIIFTGTLRYVVKGPEDTVKDFFSACNNIDLNGVLACLDPGTAKEYKFTVDLIGSMTGLGINTDSISELGGMFSNYTDPNMKILDMQTEYVKNGKKIKDPFGTSKLTASDAEVTCTYIMNDTVETDVFVLHKYSGKWKLEGE